MVVKPVRHPGSATPLLLNGCKVEDVSHPNLRLIVRQECNTKNRIIIHSSEVEEKSIR